MSKLTKARSLLEIIQDVRERGDALDEVFIVQENGDTVRLKEGKWIPTSSKNKMRIDHPTHGVGQTHVHIYGRKGEEIGVVNLDGTSSHGTSMKLSRKDAETLRSHDFTIPINRVIEWLSLEKDGFQLLLG
ncbi:MAG: hypothetical protein ACSHXZ_15110 [Gammaproteobacteria bacterium]